MNKQQDHIAQFGIAIVGMSCRFPGAKDCQTYWDNIAKGVESISFFPEEELAKKGVSQKILNDPNFVPAGGVYDEHDMFDAKFFNLLPREVEILDPQQRLFLECAYEAWEDAGYTADYYKGVVGVYGGVTMNTYMIEHVIKNPHINDIVGYLQLMIGNDKDFVTTRVSHQLRLTGPSCAIQTACSTSLVAIHHACISLLAGECDMALAGGTSLRYPNGQGYMYFNGGTSSINGHCRAFDKDATGSVVGNGGGIMVLKRYQDALADNDHIYAVIRGSATGNDGADKPAYSTPSEIGQARVITKAITLADVDAADIGYVEAHGTATNVGDPIEFTALSKSFAKTTKKKTAKNYCALGSVKANIGHLDAGAGVSGLVKVIMALRNKKIPPQINFQEINPKIDINNSPFFISTEIKEWQVKKDQKRIAGVTSIGLGGANAHVIIEEFNEKVAKREILPGPRMFPLSARTATSLTAYKEKLKTFLQGDKSINLDDVAFTLQVGRQAFEHREVIIADSLTDLVKALSEKSSHTAQLNNVKQRPKIVFMFPGQGSQYYGMFQTLYKSHAIFKRHIDECNALYQEYNGGDLVTLLNNFSENDLAQTLSLQPLLFAVEYALAQLLQHSGIVPDALIGHSLGEFVAATVAGVFDLPSAMHLICKRAVLAQSCELGTMIGINLPLKDIQKYLTEEIELSVVNSEFQCVLGGKDDAIAQLAIQLKKDNVNHTVLKTSHAFHTKLMQSAAKKILEVLNKFKLNAPTMPIISGVLGRLMSASEAQDVNYWANHICCTLQYQQGVQALMSKFDDVVYVEVGPGHILKSLLLQNSATKQPIAISEFKQDQNDQAALYKVLGQLWLSNVRIDWPKLYETKVGRVSLPTACFEKKRHFIDNLIPDQTVQIVQPSHDKNKPGAQAMDSKHISIGAKELLNEFIDMISDRQISLYISSRQANPEQKTFTQQAQPGLVIKPEKMTPVPPVQACTSGMPTMNTNNIKETLRSYWKELLGIDHIDEQQSIFELGAHSLLLTQLLIKINKQYQCGISLQELLEHATLDQMANLIHSKLGLTNTCQIQASGNEDPHNVIKGILCQSLGINELQDHQDIYSLGAHSLLVTQILKLIHGQLNVHINPTDLSTAPSLNELVTLVKAKKNPNVTSDKVVDDIMASMDGLSEQEIAELLAEVSHE